MYYKHIAQKQKARAPFATPARALMRTTVQRLVKLYGGDGLMVSYAMPDGTRITSGKADEELQALRTVRAQMWHTVRESTHWTDPGEVVMRGELYIAISPVNIAKHSR